MCALVSMCVCALCRQNYKPENVAVEDGRLLITLEDRNSSGGWLHCVVVDSGFEWTGSMAERLTES